MSYEQYFNLDDYYFIWSNRRRFHPGSCRRYSSHHLLEILPPGSSENLYYGLTICLFLHFLSFGTSERQIRRRDKEVLLYAQLRFSDEFLFFIIITVLQGLTNLLRNLFALGIVKYDSSRIHLKGSAILEFTLILGNKMHMQMGSRYLRKRRSLLS